MESLEISLIIINSKLPRGLTDTKECKGLMKAVDPRNLEILHFTKLILPFIDFSDDAMKAITSCYLIEMK